MPKAITGVAPTPFTLDRRNVLHLASDQSISLLGVDDGIWRRRTELPVFRDGRVLSVFDYASSWTWWERHPVGEEVVQVLSGSIVLHLDDGERRTKAALEEGRGLVVPQGVWHRAECAAPSCVLFVTPTPALTEHRDA